VADDSRARQNFRLILEYEGSGYHGWQRQSGVLTIQEVLESRLEVMLGVPIRVRASGRTDAGVHARGQVVNFHAATRLRPEDLVHGLNSLLPPDIAVIAAEAVDPAFHACFSAKSKTYAYTILNRAVPSALERRLSWHIRRPLQIGAMREGSRRLLGIHDFKAFMASGSAVRNTQRHLLRLELTRPDACHLVLLFEADGFLKQMVRNMVGTLVEVGRGRRRPEELADILASRDRRRAGMTAPAHGLCLLAVHY
jgi:tRNA pseudouridine38-40 synthase